MMKTKVRDFNSYPIFRHQRINEGVNLRDPKDLGTANIQPNEANVFLCT